MSQPHSLLKPNTPTPYFDFFAAPAEGSHLDALAAEVAAIVDANEERKRARKPSDAETFSRSVGALACNLALSVLTHGCGPLALSLRHDNRAWRRSRYNSHGLKARTLRGVIDAFEASGLLRLTLSPDRGRGSTLEPTAAFAAEMRRRGVTRADIAEHDGGGELIVIARRVRKEGAWRWQQAAERELVEYVDTPAIVAARRDIQALGDYLRAAPIEFVADGLEPPVDDHRRTLRRSFIAPPVEKGKPKRPPSFQQLEGGRMGGGFWMNLRKDRRRASLRIGGEPVAECDCNALFIRLALAHAGHPIAAEGGRYGGSAQSSDLAASDPYAVIEAAILKHPSWSNATTLRGSIKAAIAALLFAPHLKRFPNEVAKGFPDGFGLKDFRKAVRSVYPALLQFIDAEAGAKERPLAYRLLRLESDAILAAALNLFGKGVPVLPLHDCLMCAQSNAGVVADVLERAILERTGVVVPVPVNGERR